MRHKILMPVKLGVSGKYKAVVHKGDGVPIRETAWGKNIITGDGLDAAFVGAPLGYCVAGDGNATPSLGDTHLDSYLGKQTTTLSRSGSVNSNPGAGDLYMTTVVRSQFVPGAFGPSPVNISEAGYTMGTGNIDLIDASTPLFSRGLLVDEFGLPTAVAVQPDEYLDIFWSFTVNLPYDSVGSFDLDINGVPTSFDYTVRPSQLNPTSGLGVLPWSYASSAGLPNTQASVYAPNGFAASQSPFRCALLASGLVSPSTSRSLATADQPNTVTLAAYTNSNYYRDIDLTWTLSRGNSGGLTAILYTGFTEWQIGFDPSIPKNDTLQLDLTFRVSVENTP